MKKTLKKTLEYKRLNPLIKKAVALQYQENISFTLKDFKNTIDAYRDYKENWNGATCSKIAPICMDKLDLLFEKMWNIKEDHILIWHYPIADNANLHKKLRQNSYSWLGLSIRNVESLKQIDIEVREDIEFITAYQMQDDREKNLIYPDFIDEIMTLL